jgi:Fur family peroxide stress response transcriptional regulator
MKTMTYKHSKKLDAILSLLRSTLSHPTASWVYDRLKADIQGLSLGTVYRNITVLREQGLVRSVGVYAGEEHFDGFAEAHPHIVCTSCGAVSDIPETQADELHRFVEASSFSPFSIDARSTVFYGRCETCAADTGAERPSTTLRDQSQNKITAVYRYR